MNLPFLDTEGRVVVPPPKRRLLREFRSVLTPRPRLFRHPLLRHAPQGDGHPVFVLPGFLTNDGRTRHLRRLLVSLGYATYGWGEGVNWGPTDHAMAAIERRLREIRKRHGRRVTLIGHSLGGLLARELAKRFPDDVRGVVMLGAPIRLPTATSLAVFFRLLARFHRTARGMEIDELNLPPPPSIPVAAIYTREDGIVAWESCLELAGDRRENIEVRGTHSTLPSNPMALAIVANRLAQPEDTWQAYQQPASAVSDGAVKPRARFRRRRMSA
ncbi:MAG TPA: alpha/beta fold hydrolase [Stellaceae bacterium]|nr:alpha/beta fold hydrolase [Stellaceae bacterium]